jgi:hypothetical protein
MNEMDLAELERPTEFERMLSLLQEFSRTQLMTLVTAHASQEEVQRLDGLAERVSVDAFRFLSARALLRSRRLRV